MAPQDIDPLPFFFVLSLTHAPSFFLVMLVPLFVRFSCGEGLVLFGTPYPTFHYSTPNPNILSRTQCAVSPYTPLFFFFRVCCFFGGFADRGTRPPPLLGPTNLIASQLLIGRVVPLRPAILDSASFPPCPPTLGTSARRLFRGRCGLLLTWPRACLRCSSCAGGSRLTSFYSGYLLTIPTFNPPLLKKGIYCPVHLSPPERDSGE